MVKLQHNGKQYTITLPEDLITAMNWKKGEQLIVSKNYGEDFLYIAKIGAKERGVKK